MLYVNELKRYSKYELNSNYFLDDIMIRNLIDRRILLKVEMDIYYFEFVGVIIVKEKVIFSLPKYINKSNKKEISKQLLLLFKEYSNREKLDIDELESFGSMDLINNYNKLSVIIFILNDYLENGLYSNEKDINVINGEGEINWLKTIDNLQPLISDGQPIYLQYFTNLTQNDYENYFRQLHKYILNECMNELEKLGLLEFLGYESIEFDVDENNLGTEEYIISSINNELNIQYVNRKQLLLKAMRTFIINEQYDTNNNKISFYGTRSFHVIWEKTCGYVLNNKYDTFKKLISQPIWTAEGGKSYRAATLVPDIISTAKDCFIIFDAKYYTIKLDNNNFKNNPGVEDIMKQYLYQLAFDRFIKKKSIKFVKNILLFPSEDFYLKRSGKVSVEFLKDLNLEDISLFSVPAYLVFKYYIKRNKLNVIKFLDLKIIPIKK